jgi:hypothetical protein
MITTDRVISLIADEAAERVRLLVPESIERFNDQDTDDPYLLFGDALHQAWCQISHHPTRSDWLVYHVTSGTAVSAASIWSRTICIDLNDANFITTMAYGIADAMNALREYLACKRATK